MIIMEQIETVGGAVSFMYAWGSLMLIIRTNYLQVNDWQYISFHRSYFQGYELRTYIGKDNYIHYIEIPKNQDGTLDWSKAVYI